MTGPETAAHENQSRIILVFALTAAYLIVEIAGSIITHSLALLADASHMFVDFAMLLMTLIAIRIARRPANSLKTYGYIRTEVIVAFVNALILFGAAGYIFYQAYLRFLSPPSEIHALPLLTIAVVGFFVNLINTRTMRFSAKKSINAKGIYLESLMDSLSSGGVIATGIIILLTNAYVVDAIFSVFIGILIIPRVFELLRESSNILMEGTPSGMDVEKMLREVKKIRGIKYVHDFHVWCLTSGICSASMHVVVSNGRNKQRILRDVCGLLGDKFGIWHTTVQLESGKMRKEQIVHK